MKHSEINDWGYGYDDLVNYEPVPVANPVLDARKVTSRINGLKPKISAVERGWGASS
jgi:hypothetical protein